MTNKSPDCAGYMLCEHCLLPQPVGNFRLRYRDREVRLRQCRACHNEAERMRRAHLRAKTSRRELAKALTKIRNQRSDLQVKALCREMVVRLGGVQGFLDAWTRSMSRDLETGGHAAYRHLAAVLRLSQYCEQNRPDYGAMSEDELEAAIAALGGPLPDVEYP